MSLALTALRLQAIAAILADPVLDPILAGRAYDERISDFDHREPVPTIVVTAEEHAGEAWSSNNGGPPFDDRCVLKLEIAMTAVGDIVIDGEIVPGIGPVATDQELAATLDLIQWRCDVALGKGETPEATLLREAVTRRITKRKADIFKTDETGEKFAIRLVGYEVSLKGDDDEAFGPGEFGLLPEPLRSVASAALWPSAIKTCRMLAAKLEPLRPPPDADHPFTGMGMVLAPQPLSATATPDRAADEAAGRVIALHADP